MRRAAERKLTSSLRVALAAFVALAVSLANAALAADTTVERTEPATHRDTTVVRVAADAWTPAVAAVARPTQSLDYGSFRWLELDAADLARLAARGIAYDEVPDARQVRVPGYAFDPLADGEPQLPAGQRADLVANQTRAGFQLVQLVGPAQDGWLEGLAATGARVLQYYPHQTYLVWAPPAARQAIANRSFVRWQGAFHPAYKVDAALRAKSGLRTSIVRNVDVMFYTEDQKATLAALAALGAELLDVHPSQPDGAFADAIMRLDAAAIDAVAALPEVLWLGYQSPRPTLADETSDQIVAGNHPGGTPVVGYAAHLATLGVDGSGVTWAIVDTGVDYDHPDLASHIVGGYSFPDVPAACNPVGQPGSDCNNPNGGGHGTHVAGIVGGNATGAFTDASGFLYGLGMAPAAGIFAMNSISGVAWPPAGGWQEHSKRALLGDAVGGNNSWTSDEGLLHGYQASERTHDLMVRDGNFDTPGVAEPFIEVFAAGNSGPGAQTITSPSEAKNLIVTASSRNSRAGNIDTITPSSSRGPAVDGRIVPTLAAPGQQVASTRNDGGGFCATPIAGTANLYAFCSGTSMAAPHVSGALALITQWWRTGHAGADPSPAMAKALLVNGAVDMDPPDVPNANEGWGRINVTRVIAPPAPAQHWEQTTPLAHTGNAFTVALGVPSPGQPVKVTLAWTDAAGAVGANPALVNDLDLTVVDGANTYKGNRFSGGWSVTGGSYDARNNLENVFIQAPSGGAIQVTVAATALNGDGVPDNGDPTDQDFALVCTNCSLTPDFTLLVTPPKHAICAPASAPYTVSVGQALGFTDPVTLSASSPAPTTVGFDVNPVTPPGASTMTVSNPGPLLGPFTVQVDATSTTGTRSQTVELDVFQAVPSAVTLVSPAEGATNQPVQPTFDWLPVDEGGSYVVEIATDAAFSNVVATANATVQQLILTSASLNTSTQYYWRVRATNACGTGAFSAVRSFTTAAAAGDCGVGTLTVPLYATDFESGTAGWSHGGSVDTWALSPTRTHSGTSAFLAGDVGAVSDQYLVSPPIALPATMAPLAMKFWQRQTIQHAEGGGCHDGAVLEVSTNGGGSWTRLEAELLADPYDGPVDGGFLNPLAGSNAWCGDPQDWTYAVANVTAFAGQTAQFRWRLGTDFAVAREGWYVDDVLVQGCLPIALFADGFEGGTLGAWNGGSSP
ncbi:MAG TPA: S8 family serine peptidase [Thermoanaerobaculia bacterium]|nr:S8 family serine peptidase [Thermoanaerobaculia bacterium]